MQPKIIKEKILKEDLANITKENFGNMVKIDVDIKRKILTIGGEWHSEGNELLSKDGSSREDVWGANLYPWNSSEKRIQYNSLINIKPSLGHKSMDIKDKDICEKMHQIVQKLLLSDEENLDV